MVGAENMKMNEVLFLWEVCKSLVLVFQLWSLLCERKRWKKRKGHE
jgi:hypothetical protein